MVESENMAAGAKRGSGTKAAVANVREKQKKMLNRGNKLKDLLKTKGLVVLRAKNKLFFSYKNPQTKRKMGLGIPNSEAGNR